MTITNKIKQHSKTRTYFGLLNCRGIIFSLDAGISFTIVLVMALIFVTFLAQNASSTGKEIKNFELEEKAILIADSLVKNYDENNSTLGACILDNEKKRVRTNEISLSNLNNAKPLSLGEIYAESISIKTNSIQKTFQIETKKSIECVSVKRFVLVDGEKGIIEAKTCTTE